MLKRKFARSRYLEDFEIGETFYIPSRTIGDAEATAFRTASGDTHPLHYDTQYARERGFPNVLAHPLQILLYTTPGASDFSYLIEDTLVTFIGQSSRFVKPAFRGDSLYPELKVLRAEPEGPNGRLTLATTVMNQRAELVLEGEMTFLIKRRPAGAD
ncbi:MAG TPA: MaoC/PaaZ C-terminal domain-containing protein [Pseudomonadales bacterium]|nr:MaoC/PaaZ C-terminal domain-containing protein [Pseudomonadales bacterium]